MYAIVIFGYMHCYCWVHPIIIVGYMKLLLLDTCNYYCRIHEIASSIVGYMELLFFDTLIVLFQEDLLSLCKLFYRIHELLLLDTSFVIVGYIQFSFLDTYNYHSWIHAIIIVGYMQLL